MKSNKYLILTLLASFIVAIFIGQSLTPQLAQASTDIEKTSNPSKLKEVKLTNATISKQFHEGSLASYNEYSFTGYDENNKYVADSFTTTNMNYKPKLKTDKNKKVTLYIHTYKNHYYQ